MSPDHPHTLGIIASVLARAVHSLGEVDEITEHFRNNVRICMNVIDRSVYR